MLMRAVLITCFPPCVTVYILLNTVKDSRTLASFKSRLVLPFWYWLTQVFLEKGRSIGVVVVVNFDVVQVHKY